MANESTDVVIVGAGPLGLSLATHLRARGVEHRIFGQPMQFWRNMPPGMFLKSLGFATNIWTPAKTHTLQEYCRARDLEDYEPIELSTFAEYGRSVAATLVPYAEPIDVTSLRAEDGGFRVSLANGESTRARRVVVAVGLSNFQRLPEQLRGLPRELVSHTVEHAQFQCFQGRDVTVLGAGQSALQAAALLHEGGATVRLIARGSVYWGIQGRPDKERSLLERIRNPATVLGPGRDNWVLQHIPTLLHHLPERKRLDYNRRHFGPGGAWWLRSRVDGRISMMTKTGLLEATAARGRLRLKLAGGECGPSELVTDHLIAGTGFVVDVDRIPFLDKELASRIQRIERAPRLSRHFQSSVPGLYFIGPAAAASFGPLFRFVCGGAYAAPVVAERLSRASSSARLLGRKRVLPA